MARVLLGVSGGIAAYKAVEFVRLATEAGHAVRVLMTASARKFIGADTFEGILGAPVLSSEFEHDPMRGTFPGEPLPDHEPIGHLALAEATDIYLVAPASANTIAKLATGQADSILTTAFLACQAPRLVAPAMNDRMYRNEATQANLTTLRERGVEVIEPGEGRLASRGEFGIGRLPEPVELIARVEAALDRSGDPATEGLPAGALPTAGRDLEGLKVLVTAGGTREPVDPVRFLGNRSSGRMGFALAEAASRRGATVTLIAANVALDTPGGVRRTDIGTTAELAAATRDEFRNCDLLLMAAAPADFRPARAAAGKLVREGDGLTLELVPTEDILAGLGAERTGDQTVVGFAAEHGGEAEDRAREKLERKGADLIVLNDVSDPAIGFDSDQNEVTLVTGGRSDPVPRAGKRVVADRILDRVLELRPADGRRS